MNGHAEYESKWSFYSTLAASSHSTGDLWIVWILLHASFPLGNIAYPSHTCPGESSEPPLYLIYIFYLLLLKPKSVILIWDNYPPGFVMPF